MNKEELIKIFEDTKEHSVNMLDSITTLHTFKDIIKNKDISFKNNIKVINSDSVSAINMLIGTGVTCVLNMASAKRPGGGVAKGSQAQEECLFRCSNLTHVISTDYYPLNNYQAIYTEDAYFFKDKYYNYIDEFYSDVVTIAAINCKHDSNNPNYEEITKSKIRLMLSLAIKKEVDNIVLGAFGCGVFVNDTIIMSQYFYDILITEGYSNKFEKVIFAIINDNNSIKNNFKIFKDTFDK